VIAKKYRFHGHNSVSRVRGSRVSVGIFTIFYSKNKRTSMRLAVVVSKKISKIAVIRNRIRRRIFEAVRNQNIEDSSVDMVIVVHDIKIASMSAQDLQKQVNKACKKVISPQ